MDLLHLTSKRSKPLFIIAYSFRQREKGDGCVLSTHRLKSVILLEGRYVKYRSHYGTLHLKRSTGRAPNHINAICLHVMSRAAQGSYLPQWSPDQMVD
ncbi:hypothetical protein RRG08_047297 [Elysia crispata]|uniref:Uncharacterized protein n=1 Tax=Elysia crispata TaxID=231223 RepID=A0AAE0ZC74_9GAST|nr:hypothetical protein RRG08_047297 [Elysia crispata]